MRPRQRSRRPPQRRTRQAEPTLTRPELRLPPSHSVKVAHGSNKLSPMLRSGRRIHEQKLQRATKPRIMPGQQVTELRDDRPNGAEQVDEAHRQAVPQQQVRRLDVAQLLELVVCPLMHLQHALDRRPHEGHRADWHPCRDDTTGLSTAPLPSPQSILSRPSLDSLLDRPDSNRRTRHRRRRCRHVEHELMPCGLQPCTDVSRSDHGLQRQQHTRRRPRNLDVIVQRRQQHVREPVMHLLERQLQPSRMAQRPERAALRAAPP